MHAQSQRGFTLLETILAIGIILFGLVSLISLNTSSLISGEVTSAEFIAANFAREGMEIVRAHRDSNWLELSTNPNASVNWNDGLWVADSGEPGGIDYTAVVNVDPTVSTYFDFSPDMVGSTCTGAAGTYDCSRIWLHPTVPIYFQAGEDLYPSFDPSLYEQESYSRIVSLFPLCRHTTDPIDEQVITTGICSTTLGPLYEQVGIDVRSEVQWVNRGDAHTYTLEEYLYDWQ